MTTLKTALERWLTGRRQEALCTLLNTWQARRNRILADLIDEVSRNIDPAPAPLPGKTVTARREAWLALAAEQDPTHFERLAAGWQEKPWKPCQAKLRAWTAEDPDPRLARFAAQVMHDRPWKTQASQALYGDLLRILATARDVRSQPNPPSDTPIGWFQHQHAKLYAESAEWVDEPLTDGERRIVDEWRDLVAPADPSTLLDAVYAAPDDDGPRAVYADALAASDAHRGTFINLQLQGSTKANKAADRLRRAHGTSWVPAAINAGTNAKHTTFRRGFVHGVTFVDGYVERMELDAPAWSTVRELEAMDRYQLQRHHDGLWAQRWFRELHTAFGCTGALGETGDVAWKVADLGPYDEPDVLARMPDLEELHLDTTSPTAVLEIVQHDACPALRRLVLYERHAPAPWTAEHVASLPSTIREIRFVQRARTHHLRTDVGHHLVRRAPDGRATVHELSMKLAMLAKDTVRFADDQAHQVTLQLRGRVTWTADRRALFGAVVARYPNAAPVEPPWGDAIQTRPKSGRVVELTMEGDLAPDLVVPWIQRSPFGWSVDTLAAGRSPSRLQRNAVAHVQRWRAKERYVTLTSDGDPDRCFHFYPSNGGYLRTDGFGTPGFGDRVLAGLRELGRALSLDFVLTERPASHDLPRWRTRTGFTTSGWLTGIGPSLQRLLPVDDLLQLQLTGLTVHHDGPMVWLVHGSPPYSRPVDAMLEAEHDQLDRALASIHRKNRARQGLTLTTLVDEVLGAALTAMNAAPQDADEALHYQDGARKVWITLDPSLATDQIRLRIDQDGVRWDHVAPATGPSAVVEALELMRARL